MGGWAGVGGLVGGHGGGWVGGRAGGWVGRWVVTLAKKSLVNGISTTSCSPSGESGLVMISVLVMSMYMGAQYLRAHAHIHSGMLLGTAYAHKHSSARHLPPARLAAASTCLKRHSRQIAEPCLLGKQVLELLVHLCDLRLAQVDLPKLDPVLPVLHAMLRPTRPML